MYHIAYWPGDGIGPEVLSEARKVLIGAGFECNWTFIDWNTKDGGPPPDFLQKLLDMKIDAILLGALGDPRYQPDSVSLKPLLQMRKGFQLYACVRPGVLFDGVECPLRLKGKDTIGVEKKNGNGNAIDIVIIRENTEGEYSDSGGRQNQGTPYEVATQVNVFTRHGCERIIRYGFDTAMKRKKQLTLVTKSNAMRHSNVFMEDVFFEIAKEYPQVEVDRQLVDAVAMNLVLKPECYDCIVTTNLFGDILSDLLAGIVGGLGFAPSSNVNPDPKSEFPCLFEPVHGSALDIVGKHIANPIAAILSGSEMAKWLGEEEVATRVVKGVRRYLAKFGGSISQARTQEIDTGNHRKRRLEGMADQDMLTATPDDDIDINITPAFKRYRSGDLPASLQLLRVDSDRPEATMKMKMNEGGMDWVGSRLTELDSLIDSLTKRLDRAKEEQQELLRLRDSSNLTYLILDQWRTELNLRSPFSLLEIALPVHWWRAVASKIKEMKLQPVFAVVEAVLSRGVMENLEERVRVPGTSPGPTSPPGSIEDHRLIQSLDVLLSNQVEGDTNAIRLRVFLSLFKLTDKWRVVLMGASADQIIGAIRSLGKSQKQRIDGRVLDIVGSFDIRALVSSFKELEIVSRMAKVPLSRNLISALETMLVDPKAGSPHDSVWGHVMMICQRVSVSQ